MFVYLVISELIIHKYIFNFFNFVLILVYLDEKKITKINGNFF